MPALGIIMTQMSLKEGLRQNGKRAASVAQKEIKQQHDMETFFLRDTSSLSKEERSGALSFLIFMMEKRDGKI